MGRHVGTFVFRERENGKESHVLDRAVPLIAGLEPSSARKASSPGNRRTQRRCHSAAISIAGKRAAVALEMRVSDMG